MKARQALGVMAINDAKKNQVTTGVGSTAPTSTPVIP